MGKFKTYIPVIISLIVSFAIVAFVGFNRQEKNPSEVYKVYIDGEFIGAIKSKVALEKYINKEQKHLKEEYDVKKVYIPNGIDIEKTITYDGKIMSEEDIYKKIKQEKSFTIKGYIVTMSKDKKEDILLYLLKKDIFDKAVKNVINSFVSEEEVNNFKNDTQPEIKTVGSKIENIYLNEDVVIKEAFISTDELIFTDVLDLTKYLLFGTIDSGEEYTVKLGDTIEQVAFNNKLSTKEFLIVNPEFTSANNLLRVGQKVNISLISPIFELVVEKHVVEDVDKPFETIEKDDDTLDLGVKEVQTEGVNGIQRITEKIKYVNGQPQDVVISNKEVLKEPVNKVVLNGTKKSYYGGSYSNSGTPAITSGNWGWPTISPYVITSYFEYRWGKFHEGLDISGCGFGSPIYSIGEGDVVMTQTGCADYGYYGSSCGQGYGNYVWIRHNDNVYAVYSHLASAVLVSPGQHVSKGQIIGYMGNSGSSTGIHLHFGVYYGGTQYGQYGGGTAFNPFSLY